MKPNYKNWMPDILINILKVTAATATVGTAILAGTDKKKPAIATGAAALTLTAVFADALKMQQEFDLDNKEGLASKILKNAADKVVAPKSAKILDVGCGSGAFGFLVAKNIEDARITGIDYFQTGYKGFFSEELWYKNAKAEDIEHARFIEGDARNLPFHDQAFDVVISNYVYHNISGDKVAWVLESLRCLKKGGCFVIHDVFSKRNYGDVSMLVQSLKDMGYESVNLQPTDQGNPIPKRAARIMGIKGSSILYGIK